MRTLLVFGVITPHKYRPPQALEAPPNLTDKAQGEGSGEGSNRATHRDGIPSHVSPDSNGCNRNVFQSLGHRGFGVPSSAVARWFVRVYVVGTQRVII